MKSRQYKKQVYYEHVLYYAMTSGFAFNNALHNKIVHIVEKQFPKKGKQKSFSGAAGKDRQRKQHLGTE